MKNFINNHQKKWKNWSKNDQNLIKKMTTFDNFMNNYPGPFGTRISSLLSLGLFQTLTKTWFWGVQKRVQNWSKNHQKNIKKSSKKHQKMIKKSCNFLPIAIPIYYRVVFVPVHVRKYIYTYIYIYIYIPWFQTIPTYIYTYLYLFIPWFVKMYNQKVVTNSDINFDNNFYINFWHNISDIIFNNKI